MDTTTRTATPVYSTSTESEAVFEALSAELTEELELNLLGEDSSDWEFCFVCSRATDHRAEHDDLLEQGLVRYGAGFDGSVYLVPALAGAASL